MPIFAYKALAANGSVTTGELDAADRPEALRMLDRKGLQPVNLKETAVAASSARKNEGKKSEGKKAESKGRAGDQPRAAAKKNDKEEVIPDGPIKLKRQEVVLFTEELSDMLSAGLQPQGGFVQNPPDCARRGEFFRGAEKSESEFRAALLFAGGGG